MKIQTYQVQMKSSSIHMEQHTYAERLNIRVGGRMPTQISNEDNNSLFNAFDKISISPDAQKLLEEIKHKVKDAEKEYEDDIEESMDEKTYVTAQILKAIFGKSIEHIKASDIQPDPDDNSEIKSSEDTRLGWGMTYDYQETHAVHDETNFTSSGYIKTEDGREIQFNISLTMQRSQFESIQTHIQAGDANLIDPLVINFNGNPTQLTDTRFTFDLNSDGKMDQIPFVGSGSGFLVFDKNSNGRVDNGLEMFGPATGNGFNELASYDSDLNGWIDENDPIYNHLSIWIKDQQGIDTLYSLQDKQVGAIYLSSAQTQFDIKQSDDQLLGQIQNSSIYLKENGGAGVIQQIDLAA